MAIWGESAGGITYSSSIHAARSQVGHLLDRCVFYSLGFCTPCMGVNCPFGVRPNRKRKRELDHSLFAVCRWSGLGTGFAKAGIRVPDIGLLLYEIACGTGHWFGLGLILKKCNRRLET